jgi:hypothetical protein
VARHSEANQGIPVDWASETLVTVGATEGIAAAFLGLLNPGDEVRAGGGRAGSARHGWPGRSLGISACWYLPARVCLWTGP